MSAGDGTRQNVRQFAVFVVALLALVPYAVVALLINAQPWSAPFDGWIAVVQQSGSTFPGQVELRTDGLRLLPGGRPLLAYTVTACGSHNFEGLLLLGGNAQLDEVSVTSVVPSTSGPQVARLQPPIRSMSLAFAQGDHRFDLGHVQVVNLSIDASPICFPRQPSGEIGGGNDNVVEGVARAPNQIVATVLGWHASRLTVTWPSVGLLPHVPANDLGEFRAVEGLSGLWSLPPGIDYHVRVGEAPIGLVVETAVPPLADASQLEWQSYKPLKPIARLNNVSIMNTLQQWFAWSGILLGVAGSVLASTLFDWMRGRRSDRPDSAPAQIRSGGSRPLSQQSMTSNPLPLPLMLLALAIIAYLRSRHRR